MTPSPYQLVIGTKNTSSWSLRPWLLMKQLSLPFDEITIRLRQPDTAAEIAVYSPSGKVPALLHNGLTIWDSLAIAEYLHERYPDAGVWPGESRARAIARAVSAEMHSGFVALRQNCPMDFAGRGLVPADRAAIVADVERIVALWVDCRKTWGGTGPFLFSQFSAADAMFAPVVSRFVTYDIDVNAHEEGAIAASYRDAIFALPTMTEWGQAR